MELKSFTFDKHMNTVTSILLGTKTNSTFILLPYNLLFQNINRTIRNTNIHASRKN